MVLSTCVGLIHLQKWQRWRFLVTHIVAMEVEQKNVEYMIIVVF